MPTLVACAIFVVWVILCLRHFYSENLPISLFCGLPTVLCLECGGPPISRQINLFPGDNRRFYVGLILVLMHTLQFCATKHMVAKRP